VRSFSIVASAVLPPLVGWDPCKHLQTSRATMLEIGRFEMKSDSAAKCLNPNWLRLGEGERRWHGNRPNRTHNPKVASSNLAPATSTHTATRARKGNDFKGLRGPLIHFWARGRERRFDSKT
jgi:hypothetical protein